MTDENTNQDKIEVLSSVNYVPQQSNPNAKRFVFKYTITIKNHSSKPCQLMSRHWIITDANKKIEEVYGEGVIGVQPIIGPGKEYQYSSGAVLDTEIGTMEGRYFMLREAEGSAKEFEIQIPKFTLTVPRILH